VVVSVVDEVGSNYDCNIGRVVELAVVAAIAGGWYNWEHNCCTVAAVAADTAVVSIAAAMAYS
jgi:hypothetical protein